MDQLENIDISKKDDYDALKLAKEVTLANMQKKPTKANLEAFQKASSMLDEFLAAQAGDQPDPDRFATRKEALLFLQEEDFKIKKQKIYDDVKKGLLKMQEDGSIRKVDLLIYSGTLKKVPGSSLDAEEDQARKRKLEIKNLEMKNRREEFNHDKEMGKYILKTEADLNQVNLLAVLDVNFRQMMDEIMPDLCHALGGNVTRLNLGQELAESKWEKMLHSLTRTDTYKIEYMEAEQDGSDL